MEKGSGVIKLQSQETPDQMNPLPHCVWVAGVGSLKRFGSLTGNLNVTIACVWEERK